ncbi:MAG TPA: YifB family Mg chelatase-like AAA ATPase [Candidatus Kapabacteria bacterium]|nr:YifB family Mg chelatase-like AAA ATPase [Candidatus Kapabacteria bacterium]
MYSRLVSASLVGISAYPIQIETHLDMQLPSFTIVGLPDSSVKEARERVGAAIKNSEFMFPAKKITINLAPADIRKEGSAFDLPIALGILASSGLIDYSSLEKCIFLGELSLEGFLRPIKGALPIALEAKKQGFEKIILPYQNAEEAAMVTDIAIIATHNLKEVVQYINNEIEIQPSKVDIEAYFNTEKYDDLLNLKDVKGQESVKRALEVAAAGGHNLLMLGPPGSGKTMLAKRITTILPPLTLEEALETTKIHSISGFLPEGTPLISVRPFRSPHHTISDAALVGGGMSKIRPGEISLAHHGVLFLDELPEFARNVLEVMRQPLEDKRIIISRTKTTIEYPANFMLICSMNPCPCGNYGDPTKECSCTPQKIQNYLSKISGPLLDRIDIHVEVPAVKYQELSSKREGESSEVIRNRVINARKIQQNRFADTPSFKNADMNSNELREFCELDNASQDILKVAMEKLGLSARAYDRILKVSRTIADLDESKNIKVKHISEAIQYRSLDRDYWK